MAGSSCSSSSVVPSLPLPRPKSPPEYPDLYGKRREVAKVQMLEREITFLEGELKLVESLQPASRSCKEVADYVGANSDPFIPTSRKIRRSCSFWKWLCGSPCFNFSWICCFSCTPRLKMPHCSCDCDLCNFHSCVSCSMPKCRCCCFWPQSRCFNKISCSCKCCIPRCPSCRPNCSCSLRWCRCWSCPKCPRVNLCCCCINNCCYPCCLCY
ncbi:guanine nucleotide-binding protein subunit gamma 3-like isoform X4 [Actinidia eriantha]|uniref:guanine nucleotide-binding protein subunit gamma 3-like isoform X4 n=1 Tax=Actinidia eriantha TaxID=165200 RepID=UPI00258A25E5|nr:guanine nucleotide-binding protein subunit gamma 3-like isoform X4 [Actinidia eriantha]